MSGSGHMRAPANRQRPGQDDPAEMHPAPCADRTSAVVGLNRAAAGLVIVGAS